jgi:hypothetical protein
MNNQGRSSNSSSLTNSGALNTIFGELPSPFETNHNVINYFKRSPSSGLSPGARIYSPNMYDVQPAFSSSSSKNGVGNHKNQVDVNEEDYIIKGRNLFETFK